MEKIRKKHKPVRRHTEIFIFWNKYFVSANYFIALIISLWFISKNCMALLVYFVNKNRKNLLLCQYYLFFKNISLHCLLVQRTFYCFLIFFFFRFDSKKYFHIRYILLSTRQKKLGKTFQFLLNVLWHSRQIFIINRIILLYINCSYYYCVIY